MSVANSLTLNQRVTEEAQNAETILEKAAMLSLKQITTKIAGIKKAQSKIADEIQTVMCNIAGHTYQHGDNTSISPLLDAVKGQDRKAIMEWLTEFAFVRFDKDGTVSTLSLKQRKEKAAFTTAEEVVEWTTNNARHWTDKAITKEAAARALNVAQRLESIAKAIHDARTEGRDLSADKAAIEAAYRNILAALDSAA